VAENIQKTRRDSSTLDRNACRILIKRWNTDREDFTVMQMQFVSRPFCKQCFDKPQHIPWVDELQRADSTTEPWSIQEIDILPEISDDELRQLQNDDPSIGLIKEMIVQGEAPTIDTLRSPPLEVRKIWSLRPTVVMQNNLLVRKDEDRTQLVVPTSLRERLFSHVH